MDEDVIEIPSKTYKVINGRVAGYLDGLEAVRQAVEKILSTDRFGWEIYSEDYGSEANTLIGEDFDLVNSELERIITEALTADERILEIQNFNLKQTSTTSVLATFDVATVFGEIKVEEEVSI